MKPINNGKKLKRTYSKHGLSGMKQALNRLGNRAIDQRTKMAKALKRWEADLIKDLGGSVSIQQRTIIELAARSKLILDSIDTWLLNQDSMINKRKRSLIPVVQQRTQIADSLARYLKDLGLERKIQEIDLSTALAKIN